MTTVWATKTSRLLWQVAGCSQLLFIGFCMSLSHKHAFVSQVFICSLWCIPLTQEVGISELPASYVIRNKPPKLEFRSESQRNLKNNEFAIQYTAAPFINTQWKLFFSITEKSYTQYCATSTATKCCSCAFTCKLSATSVLLCAANNANDNRKTLASCFLPTYNWNAVNPNVTSFLVPHSDFWG